MDLKVALTVDTKRIAEAAADSEEQALYVKELSTSFDIIERILSKLASYEETKSFHAVINSMKHQLGEVVELTDEFLKIIDMAYGEQYEGTFAVIRHAAFLLALPILALAYIRDDPNLAYI